MADHLKVAVYLRASEVRMLKEHQQDPKKWVRAQVKAALALEREMPAELLAEIAEEKPVQPWPEQQAAARHDPEPLPPSMWQSAQELAVEEVAAGEAPGARQEVVLATPPPASTARCRKEATHHIYHAGKPCPVCGFPHHEGS